MSISMTPSRPAMNTRLLTALVIVSTFSSFLFGQILSATNSSVGFINARLDVCAGAEGNNPT